MTYDLRLPTYDIRLTTRTSSIHPPQPVHRRHPLDRLQRRADAEVDAVLLGHGHDLVERLDHDPLESLVDGVLIPEVAAAVLHPFEVADRDAARVRQDIRDEEDPLLLENLVGVRRRGAVGTLADD